MSERALKISDLLFFDNLALYYVANETPPRVLARVFASSDPRLGGSLLGVLDPERRKILHALMAQESDGDEGKNSSAADALLIIAGGLLDRGHIERKGRFFYGLKAEGQEA